MSLLKFVSHCSECQVTVQNRIVKADFPIRAYKGLSPKAKLGVGVGLLAWGVVGLYVSDHAEEKYGFTPSEKDKADLEMMKPKISFVDKEVRP